MLTLTREIRLALFAAIDNLNPTLFVLTTQLFFFFLNNSRSFYRGVRQELLQEYVRY